MSGVIRVDTAELRERLEARGYRGRRLRREMEKRLLHFLRPRCAPHRVEVSMAGPISITIHSASGGYWL